MPTVNPSAPRPDSRTDLAAFLAVLVTGVILILATHVPAADTAMTATAVLGAYTQWRSGPSTR